MGRKQCHIGQKRGGGQTKSATLRHSAALHAHFFRKCHFARCSVALLGAMRVILVPGAASSRTTFHSAIDLTPRQALARCRPTSCNLLTFGCTATPKTARDRTSALNPKLHNGIFLGHLLNNDIRHWDINAQSEKTAGQGEHDELQRGNDPAQRSPVSKHLLSVMTSADHAERGTDIMHDKATKVAPKTASAPHRRCTAGS